MAPKPGLVILHLDGVGYDSLLEAVEGGEMLYVAELVDRGGYAAVPYLCGVPSTTPFVQAGIIYGDNSEIPAFRWWDKELGAAVRFGPHSSFRAVAGKYFEGCRALTAGGACIAACFPGDAAETFGLAYSERSYRGRHGSHSALHVIGRFFTNPTHVADFFHEAGSATTQIAAGYVHSRSAGRHPSVPYVITDYLEEVIVHHVTRFAVRQAMSEGYPVIYAGLYAYDETAHAFGPKDAFSRRILRHLDASVRTIDGARTSGGPRHYEMIVLSDHGQVETIPFSAPDGKHLGEIVAGWLPGCRVTEVVGHTFGPSRGAKAHLALIFSCNLGNLYITDVPGRLSLEEVERHLPGLLDRLAGLDRIEFLMVRDQGQDLLVLGGGRRVRLETAGELLQKYGDPAVLIPQLRKLNSFERAGDAILFGSSVNGLQVNFENQRGGHGGLGGEQARPFVLAPRAWGLPVAEVTDAAQLHSIFEGLLERLGISGSPEARTGRTRPMLEDRPELVGDKAQVGADPPAQDATA